LPVNGLAADGALVDQLMALDGPKNDEQWQQQKISSERPGANGFD